MTKKAVHYLGFILATIILASCVGDDFINDRVDPLIRITNPVDTIELNTTYQYEAIYLNEVGQQETVNFEWSSSNASVISLTDSGLASANALGDALITISYQDGSMTLIEETMVSVGNSTVSSNESITGTIQTTSFYTLEGDFELLETDTGLELNIMDNYQASSNLPGLYIYLSNNRNSVANALEVSPVTVFQGSHSYTIEDVGLNDYQFIVYYCKPFNVKVGEAEL